MSITIIERRDRKQAQDLIKILEEAGQDVPEELSNMADRYARWKERDDEAKAEFRASGILNFILNRLRSLVLVNIINCITVVNVWIQISYSKFNLLLNF